MGKMLLVCFLSMLSIAHADEPIEILMLGDSLTQGYGLVEEDGLVTQLNAYLVNEGLDVRLINAGVSGDTTAGGLERIAWSLRKGLDFVIIALGSNDMLRGIDPGMVQSNLTGILEVLNDEDLGVMIIGAYAPRNFGPEYKKEFDEIFPNLARKYSTNYVPSLFEAFIQDGKYMKNLINYFQTDGLHPNKDGVNLIVEYLGPQVAGMIKEHRK